MCVCLVAEAMADINEQAEVEEEKRKNERKRRREEMSHQCLHHGSVMRLDVCLLVKPKLVWSIMCDSFMDGWLE